MDVVDGVIGQMPGEWSRVAWKIPVDTPAARPPATSAPKPAPTGGKGSASTPTPKPAAKDPAGPSKASTSTPKPTDSAPAKGAKPTTTGKGTPSKPAPSTPKADEHRNQYAEQQEAQARAAKHAEAGTAAKLDAAVPKPERDRLLKEQKEFYGVTKVKTGGLTGGGPVQNAPTPSPAPGPAPTPPAPSSGGGKAHPAKPSAAIPAPTPTPRAPGGATAGGPVVSEVPRKTPDEQRAFLKDRPYWIGDDGKVWRVETQDDGTIKVDRSDDPEPVSPPNLGRPDYVEFVDKDGKPLPKDGPVVGGATVPGKRFPGQGVPTQTGILEGSGKAPRATQAELLGLGDPALVRARTVGERQVGVVDPKAGAPEGTRSKHSAVTYLLPEGDTASERTTETRTPAGVTSLSIDRSRLSDTGEMKGVELFNRLEATRPDSSTAIVTEDLSIGSYAKDPKADRPEVVRSADVRDATGAWTHSNSADPKPRPAPKTLDELRKMQDEYGTAFAGEEGGASGAPGMGQRVPGSVDEMFATAATVRADNDRQPLEKAIFDGSRQIGKDHPEQVQQYGDQQFEKVRKRMADWGLTAADGNEDIKRTWKDDGVPDNAFYSSEDDSMHFGVGSDGTPFGLGDDVIGHEFTHRIVGHNAPELPYEGQQGAVNESLADTLGAAVDEEDWRIGEDIVEGGGIRDMSRPVTMKDYENTESDHGGVHTNSAIPNHAAYLIGDELGKDTMGRIYARTISQHIDNDTDFKELATGTYRSAVELYGVDSAQARAVTQAWDGVLELHGSRDLWTTQPDAPKVSAGGFSPTPHR